MTILANAILAVTILLQANQGPFVVAHRGAWIRNEVPENSLAGIETAARYGIKAIECDVKYTSNRKLVVMHDRSINRTMKTAEGYEDIKGEVKVSGHTYNGLRNNYVFATDRKSGRQPLPTLEEVLYACKKYGVTPMLHSEIVESYQMAQQILGNGWIAFDGNYASLVEARKISDCLILWDPGNTGADETVAKLKAIGGRVGMSTMKRELLTPEYCKLMKDNGFEVQSSIFPAPYEADAIANGATIILSDFCWIPDASVKPYMTKSFKKTELKAGQVLEYAWGHCDYGSVTLSLSFTGKLEITSPCGQKYVVEASESKDFLDGWRVYNCEPGLSIKALENSQISTLTWKYYR